MSKWHKDTIANRFVPGLMFSPRRRTEMRMRAFIENDVGVPSDDYFATYGLTKPEITHLFDRMHDLFGCKTWLFDSIEAEAARMQEEVVWMLREVDGIRSNPYHQLAQ